MSEWSTTDGSAVPSPESCDPRVEGLLARWEKSHAQGHDVPPEELCRDCPELLADLRREIIGLTTLPPGPSHAPEPLLPAVPGYQVLKVLGRGGMGVVYEARQVRPSRLVALKMVQGGPLGEAEDLARFRNEAEAIARLRHPNIVQVYEAGEHAGRAFFSMEYVEGGSLADRLRAAPLPVEEATRLVAALAEAVQHAHERGILHRDLKPANVLLARGDGYEGEPKIADFGLAKLLDEQGQTRTGAVLGTPGFMAPEQARGASGAVGPHADVWSLGAVLYACLTGGPPFRGATAHEALMQTLGEEPAPPSRLRGGLPPDLETICLKCLQKEPARRYATAADLAADLGRLLRGEAIRARPLGRVERLARWVRRNRALAGLAAAVLLLLVFITAGSLVAALLLSRGRDRALANLDRAEGAELEAERRLYRARLLQAEASRSGGRQGQRLNGLQALRDAAGQRDRLELGEEDLLALRSEMGACLALVDVRLDKQWPGYPKTAPDGVIAFDPDVRFYARMDDPDAVVIRRMEDDGVEKRLPGLAGVVNRPQLRFSPDGKYLAAWFLRDILLVKRAALYVWEWRSGKALVNGRRVVATSVDFSPDSQSLAVGLRDGPIVFLDVASGQEVERLPSKVRPNWVRFDPSGTRLAVVREGHVEVITLADGKVRQLHPPHPWPHMVAWSADGRLLASNLVDNVPAMACVWDVESGKVQSTLRGHDLAVVHVAFHPSGLVATSSWDGTSRLWEPWGGRQLLAWEGGATEFSRDGRWLGSGAHPGFVAGRWEVVTSPERRLLGTPSPQVSTVAFGAGRALAAAEQTGVRVWDLEASKWVAFLPAPSVVGVAFHPSGSHLLAGTRDALLRWPVRVGPEGLSVAREPEVMIQQNGAAYGKIAFDRAGTVVAVVVAHGTPQGSVRVVPWHKGGEALFAAPLINAGHVSLSPDARWLAVGAFNGDRVVVWDLTKKKVAWERRLPGAVVVDFSPDGRWLLVSAWGEQLFLRVGSWELHERWQLPVGSFSHTFAFTTNGNYLAVGEPGGVTRLRDAATWKERITFVSDGRKTPGRPFLSEGGEWLATTDESPVVRLWDLRRLRAELAKHGLHW